jgi:hypothetical protein
MRTGVLSDDSVRRFCKTIERDDSTAPLARRLLATRGNRLKFARGLAEATYTPEELDVASPRMYAAMFKRAAHLMTAPEEEVWEGYEEFVASEVGEEEEGEDAFSDAEEEFAYESEDEDEFVEPSPALVQFEPLLPSVAGSSTDPMTPPPSSRRRSYTMQSTFSISGEPVPLPIGKQLNFNDPKDKSDISRPRSRAARAPRARAFMKNASRSDLIALYNESYRDAYGTAPPPLDDVTTQQLADEIINMV